jgi:hypothetical protein
MNEGEHDNLVGGHFVHEAIASNEYLANTVRVELWYDAPPLAEELE